MAHRNNYIHREVDTLALKQLKQNWSWYFMLGIGLVVLGTLAILYSMTSTLVSVIYYGIFLIVVGLFEGAKALKMSRWSSFFLHLFLAVLYAIGGGFIFMYPAESSLSLTLLLAIFFVISGAMRIVFSFARNIPNRGWMLFNGICTLILGILIWRQWPMSGLWVIGTLVGVEALITGWAWIMLSLKAKNMKISE